MNKNTVIINGTEFDALTGVAIRKVAPTKDTSHATKPAQPHAAHLHSHTQKSQTLSRKFVKHTPVPARVAHASHVPVSRSPHITKFAPHPSAPATTQPKTMDIGPVRHHPLATKVHAAQSLQAAARIPTPPKPAGIIKNEAIARAMEQANSRSQREVAQTVPRTGRSSSRRFSFAAAAIALILLGGYFTYINMPSLSVRVAASQAGINATYPAYRPDGYSLSGPIAYSSGEVNMKFVATAGNQNFSLGQSQSSWDSSAVLDNYVRQKAADNYTTYNENGLTIYTFGGNAAWVNGGILYTISGDAPLSGEQIRHIATSM